MFNSQAHRNVFIAVAAAAFLTLAGCSNQPEQATNQAPAPAKKAAPTKLASSKPAAAQPAAKKADAGKSASGKAAAKPVSATSKVNPATKVVTVPKGTFITTTLGQQLASNKNKAGDSFAATLSSSVKVDGKTIIPKGAHVTGRVVTAKKKDPAELTVALSSVEVGGKSYPLATNSIGPSDKAKSEPTDAAKQKKDITLAAQAHLKFKLAKSLKIPVKS